MSIIEKISNKCLMLSNRILLTPAIDTKEREIIYIEAINFLFKIEPIVFTILPLSTAIVCWGLWNIVDHRDLVLWQIIVILISLLRYVIYIIYMRLNDNKNPLRWANYYTLHYFILGLVWVYASYLFLSQANSYGHILWLMFIVGGFAAVTPFLSYWYPSLIAYISPTLLTMPVMLWMYDIPEYKALSILSIVGSLLAIFISYRSHLFIIDSIALRIQNFELLSKLRKEKEHAEQSDRAKSTFLATASHDLRQPLQALNLYLDALKLRLNTEEQYEILSKLKQSEQALGDLLNALLNISKLDTGNLSIHKEVIPCAEFMYGLGIELMPQFEEKNINFKIHPKSVFLYSDITSLTRIIRNLLKNALRYTSQGTVLFAARYRGNDIELQVWDTGSGIPAEKQGEIFDDFVQLHNYERHQKQGLGLGLSIVKRLAVLLNHPIKLRSCLNKGSMFSIKVPIAEAATVEIFTQITKIRTDEVHVLTTDHHLETIVLVEDQDEVLQAMVLLLESWNYKVISGHNLEAVIDKINHLGCHPNAIISDYRLVPPMTGIDVIYALREFCQEDIPAVIITGDTSPEILNIFKEAAIPILHKPIQSARLRTFLQRAVISHPEI